MLDNLLRAIGEALGLVKQELDPEVQRKKRISAIDAEIKSRVEDEQKLLAVTITPDNKEQNAVALGLNLRRIIELRAERKSLSR